MRAARWLPLALVLLGMLAGAAFGQDATRVAQAGGMRGFDHLRTGFPLTGAHASQRCESCHIAGLFRGTPRDCASCHVAGSRFARGNVVKPTTHVATQLGCETCHNTSTYIGARFNHVGVRPGSCVTCHNGTSASGKPARHVVTAAACDSCHRTTAWRPAGFNHASVAVGTCASCHNGTTATGKTPSHLATTASCDACHRTTAWTPATFNHAGVAAGTCASCHNGTSATGKPAGGHVPTTLSCDACHTSTVAWLPVPPTFGHAGIAPGTCISCHGGAFGSIDVKPASHITTTAQCDVCHRTTAWKPATFSHATVVAGSCATCHNGVQASGKPASGHIPTTQSCDACHTSTVAWLPVPPTYGHAAIAPSTCNTCHGGAYANIDVKPANHVVTTQQCDVCHRTTAWIPATFSHIGIAAGTCAACHNGTNATGKPAGHLVTTASCDVCHSTAAWKPATFSHAGVVAGTCATCHNGTTATGKNPTHIPTTASCDACHSTTVWKPATMNHTVVAGTPCKTCHNGSYTMVGTTGALAKPVNHIPEAQLLNGAAMDCNACHTSTTTWTAFAMNHNGSQGSGSGWCKACHQSGTSYLGPMDRMPLNHRNRTPAPIDCSESGCHRPLGGVGSTYRTWN